jgi:hypothetical protein
MNILPIFDETVFKRMGKSRGYKFPPLCLDTTYSPDSMFKKLVNDAN